MCKQTESFMQIVNFNFVRNTANKHSGAVAMVDESGVVGDYSAITRRPTLRAMAARLQALGRRRELQH